MLIIDYVFDCNPYTGVTVRTVTYVRNCEMLQAEFNKMGGNKTEDFLYRIVNKSTEKRQSDMFFIVLSHCYHSRNGLDNSLDSIKGDRLKK